MGSIPLYIDCSSIGHRGPNLWPEIPNWPKTWSLCDYLLEHRWDNVVKVGGDFANLLDQVFCFPTLTELLPFCTMTQFLNNH